MLALALGLALIMIPAQAKDGADLYEECTSSDASHRWACAAYGLGVVDALVVVQKISPGAVPPICGKGDLFDRFIQWAHRHPETLTRNASEVFIASLSDLTECQ